MRVFPFGFYPLSRPDLQAFARFTLEAAAFLHEIGKLDLWIEKAEAVARSEKDQPEYPRPVPERSVRSTHRNLRFLIDVSCLTGPQSY